MPLSPRKRVMAAMAGHTKVCPVCSDTFEHGKTLMDVTQIGPVWLQLCSQRCLSWYEKLGEHGRERLCQRWMSLVKLYKDSW